MADEPAQAEEEVVDADVVGEEELPREELRDAVDEAVSAAAMTVAEPADRHEGLIAMDAHDSARLLERITRQAQEQNLGKRWVYQLPGRDGAKGLTVDAVEDITQQMNWTGKCAIGILPETLEVEVIEADEGEGDEKFWVATVAAEDARTGSRLLGTAMEPQRMKLKPSTAKAKREEGKPIPEDDKVFDRYSRAKAVGKAQRNALESFIPEVVKVTLIAMAAQNPGMVERIETAEEAKIKEMPPPLDTEEARAIKAEMATMYDGIRELGGGKGRVLLTPGRYNAALLHAQHDMAALQAMKLWLEQRREEISAQLENNDGKETS